MRRELRPTTPAGRSTSGRINGKCPSGNARKRRPAAEAARGAVGSRAWPSWRRLAGFIRKRLSALLLSYPHRKQRHMGPRSFPLRRLRPSVNLGSADLTTPLARASGAPTTSKPVAEFSAARGKCPIAAVLGASCKRHASPPALGDRIDAARDSFEASRQSTRYIAKSNDYTVA